MLDDMRRMLERQLAGLLDETERPMTVEEMIPHLSPVMPGPNDVADLLEDMRRRGVRLEREGSYWRRPPAPPLERLFGPGARETAALVVDLLRELDQEGQGASYQRLVQRALERGVSMDRVVDVVTRLKHAGEVYEAKGSRLRLTKG